MLIFVVIALGVPVRRQLLPVAGRVARVGEAVIEFRATNVEARCFDVVVGKLLVVGDLGGIGFLGPG